MSSEKSKFYFFFLKSTEINQIEEYLKKCPTEVDSDFGVGIGVINNSILNKLKENFELGNIIGLSIRNAKAELIGLVSYNINDSNIEILGIYTCSKDFEEVIKQLISFLKNKYRTNITINLPEHLNPSILKKITTNMKLVKCTEDGIIYDATNFK